MPKAYRACFRDAQDTLESHRGYDIGALGAALRMASQLSAPVIFSTITRLLIDLNRSLDQPDTFSEFTRDLPATEKERIVADIHTPHREAIESLVASMIDAGRSVLHIGVHSCADELNGAARELDIALLFDEERVRENRFCERWQSELIRHDPTLRCPFNEPYRGADDGLTTTLRSRFAPSAYLGIEVELRQGMVRRSDEQEAAGDILAATLSRTLA